MTSQLKYSCADNQQVLIVPQNIVSVSRYLWKIKITANELKILHYIKYIQVLFKQIVDFFTVCYSF